MRKGLEEFDDVEGRELDGEGAVLRTRQDGEYRAVRRLK